MRQRSGRGAALIRRFFHQSKHDEQTEEDHDAAGDENLAFVIGKHVGHVRGLRYCRVAPGVSSRRETDARRPDAQSDGQKERGDSGSTIHLSTRPATYMWPIQ